MAAAADRKEKQMVVTRRVRRVLELRRLLVVFFVLSLALPGCSSSTTVRPKGPNDNESSAAPAFPVTLTDDDGVQLTMKAPPARIITFAPSNTEIVFALGLGSRLVAVSGSFDNYPPAARSIEQVGGSGEFGVDPNAEKVVSLHPDLLLAISGGDQWKQQLRGLGIAVFTVNAENFDDLLHDIGTVGRLTGATGEATKLTGQMLAKAQQIQGEAAKEAPVSCFFEAFYPPLTTVGPNTFIFDLLKRSGCEPVSSGAKDDYPEWSVDKLVDEGPAVYLVASESGVSPDAVAKRPGFSAIAAVSAGMVFLVDSDLVSRPGPRVVDGLLAFAKLLHPTVVTSA
jgi:iron complex transport system substrate-binding protein